MDFKSLFWERLKRKPRYKEARRQFIKRFPDYPGGQWTEELYAELDKFITKWGIAPIDPDIKDFETSTHYYSEDVDKDGTCLIRIFPWTTKEEVIEKFETIRKSQPQIQIHKEELSKQMKIISLKNEGKSWKEIGKIIFKDSLNKEKLCQLKCDERFEKLTNIFTADGFTKEEAEKKALEKIHFEDIFKKLKNQEYVCGERTKCFEEKAQKIYDSIKFFHE